MRVLSAVLAVSAIVGASVSAPMLAQQPAAKAPAAASKVVVYKSPT